LAYVATFGIVDSRHDVEIAFCGESHAFQDFFRTFRDAVESSTDVVDLEGIWN
jgi:hypothetical protein